MSKHIGITLLIVERKSENKFRATLVSFVFDFFSLEKLKNTINSEVLKFGWTTLHRNEINSSKFTYYGIEDAFSVSDKLSNGCLLGKSTLDHLDSLDKSYSLVRSIEKYNFKDLLKDTGNEFVASLIYFYSDRKNDDHFTISCLFYFDLSFHETLKEIKDRANSKLYKEKIIQISSPEDKLKINQLKFVGVEDISPRSKIAKSFGGFEAHYRDFNNVKEILEIVPDEDEVLNFLK